jgi:hypothetical protein
MRRVGVALVLLVLAALAGVRLWGAVAVPSPAERAEAALIGVYRHGRSVLAHEAAESWRDALVRSPADPFAWSGLAWAEAARGAPVPYVDRLMARAAALGPHVPEIAQARALWDSRRRPAAPAP